MKKIIFSLFCFASISLFSQYYIDNTGTGDTLATIAEVNAITKSPGDTFYFSTDCEWRDDVVLNQSGTAGNYIVFTTYGTGAKPKIYGSDQAVTWTHRGGNVWSSATTLANPYAGDDMEVWFIETDDSVKWGDQQVDTASLVAEYDWAWAANVLYVYAVTDPDTRYTSIECPQRYYMFDLNEQEYIEVNGFELAFGLSGARSEDNGDGDYTGSIVRNNTIHHLGTIDGGGYGYFVVYNESLIENNEIYGCGRRGISLYNYGDDTIENIVVQNNYFHDNFHTIGIDISSGGGDPVGSFDSIIIRNNFIQGDDSSDLANPPADVFFRVEGTTALTKRMYIYNNVFTWCQGGLLFQSNDVGVVNGFIDIYIYNNTFYGVNKLQAEGRNFISFNGVMNGDIKIKNNIFYQDADPDSLNVTSITLQGGVVYSDIDADYNLYYASDGTPADVKIVRQNPPLVDWYHDDLAAMQAAWSWDVHSPAVSDPLFINVTYPVEVDSLIIDALSPAVDAGVGLGAITTYDYYDSLRDASPDIGAIEYNSTAPGEVDPPTVTTTQPTIKNARASTGGGNVTSGDAVSARGIVWAVTPNPDITDNKTSNGTGTGAFTAWIGVHNADDTIYVRAYATNVGGTAYGDNVTWITPPAIYSDSLAVGGTDYIDSLFVRNDSLILRLTTGKEFGIIKYE